MKVINQNPKACGDPGAVTFSFQAWILVGDDAVGASNKRFIDDLVSAGVVTLLGTEKNTGFVPGTLYKLAAVTQEGVEWDYPNASGGTITFTLATGKVKEVTGILPDDDVAVVNVVIARSPTPLYQKLQNALKDGFATCTNPDVQNTVFCTNWPKDTDVISTVPLQERLFRQDHGWQCQ